MWVLFFLMLLYYTEALLSLCVAVVSIRKHWTELEMWNEESDQVRELGDIEIIYIIIKLRHRYSFRMMMLKLHFISSLDSAGISLHGVTVWTCTIVKREKKSMSVHHTHCSRDRNATLLVKLILR